ncbi:MULTISPECIES: caspase family protein [unclassified Ruegeria]|uniref:caspase family protein n=1 Tax=unclassified Ruegeria TaxID=2625375 RepID=UPI001ADC4CB6|nr:MULTISPECIES: caspase family protein [unclassified Ruegeria]MBO9413769.1 caspase family protein [Ruegeria sp. R8_1]MBO9417761.1 caspase family protein [Ruegeria sp. R8_2]
MISKKYLSKLAVASAFLLPCSSAAVAQGSSWTVQNDEARTCDPNRPDNCIALRCASGNNYVLNVTGDGIRKGIGQISVDGYRSGRGEFVEDRGGASILVDRNSGVVSDMRRGSKMRASFGFRAVTVSLRGSSAAIKSLKAVCSGSGQAKDASSGWSAGYKRRTDEPTFELDMDPGSFNAFGKRFAADIPGNDLRTPFDRSLMRDLSRNQCEALCTWTENCRGYTWNEDAGRVCLLKSRAGKMVSFKGAVSSHIQIENKSIPYPPTRGPLPKVDATVTWKEGDTEEGFVSRVRKASAGLGRSCNAEMEALERLASSVQISVPQKTQRVGTPVEVEWSGNSLEDRIPVWIVASSPDYFRTRGLGAMTLGPEALGPFGLSHAKEHTRTFVPLWARGTGTSGQVVIEPLKAGKLELNVALVAYLRACGKEVVLDTQSHVMPVNPKPAQLVVGTAESQKDLTHYVDIPQFDRRVLAGENRFRIISSSTGSEIVERAGSKATLSPTGRFLIVLHDEHHELIDVVDGETVSKLKIFKDTLYWGAADSFVFGSNAPWGKVEAALTFSNRKVVENQLTGPACCAANPDKTQVHFSTENALLEVRGSLGYALSPLHGSVFAREGVGTGYLSSEDWSPALQVTLLRSVGLVSPVSAEPGFSATNLVKAEQKPIVEIGVAVNNQVADEKIQMASLFRGAGGAEAGAAGAFERIGISLAQGARGERLVEPEETPLGAEASTYRNAQELTTLKSALRDVTEDTNWRIELLPEPDNNLYASSCFDYLGSRRKDGSLSLPVEADITEQTVLPTPGYLAIPENIAQLDKIRFRGGSVLVGRAYCVSGATGGSLRGSAHLFVLNTTDEMHVQVLKDASISQSHFLGANYVRSFEENVFDAVLFGETLVLLAPGNGRMIAYDLKSGKVVREFENLPSGDLLVDVALTADGSHIIQINSDGSFYGWSISSGEQAFAGRVVEDEIAVWSPEYFFDATAEAASLIDLRFPGLDEQFSLDRFSTKLYRDGLLRSLLGAREFAPVEISIPPAVSGQLTADGAQIHAEIELQPDRQANLLQVFQDGILTNELQIKETDYFVDTTFDRLAGAQHASIIAVSKEGLASTPLTVDLGKPLVAAENRALAIAVDRYKHPRLENLNYAKADADRILTSLTGIPDRDLAFDKANFIGGRRAKPDEALTGIRDLLNGLDKTGNAVLFLAGHGLQGDDGSFYLAMHDTDPSDLKNTALNFEDVAAMLRQTEARITILIDACHSGDAGSGMFATNDGALNGLTNLPENITILAAAKGRQFSIESDELEGGLFSVAVERVINTQRDAYDLNANGRIESSELAKGVKSIVRAQSEGRQVPWMTRGRVIGDYSLF